MIALGCLSEKRGGDSAGVGWCVGGRVRIAKIAQNPLVAFPVTLAPAIRHATKYAGPLIGHTRQATTGAVSTPNAHPFYDKESEIAWAHNGIITNYRTFGEFNVDSESLIIGIKKRDFKDYMGPVALLWIENGKLHAFRKGNPLYRGVRKEAVYLASEQNMLAEIGCRKIKELSEGHLYVWDEMTLESSKTIPCNKSYRSTYGYPMYDGDEEWKGWRSGGKWDTEKKCWVYEGENSFTQRQSTIHGCSSGGDRRGRAAGFRPFKRDKVDENVHGDTPIVPAIVNETKGDTGPVAKTDEVHEGEDRSKDTAQVLDALTVRDTRSLGERYADHMRQQILEGSTEEKSLIEEINEQDKLCVECSEHPKIENRDYCESCYVSFINHVGD